MKSLKTSQDVVIGPVAMGSDESEIPGFRISRPPIKMTANRGQQMKCAYCLEEMNEGASVCRACGRKQRHPLTDDQWSNILFGVGGIVLLVACGIGYDHYDAAAKKAAIDKAVTCLRAKGFGGAQDFLPKDMDTLESRFHMGWRENLKLADKLGCPST